MKTHELFEALTLNNGKTLNFILPEGRQLSGDLHITEVKNVIVESVDCGTNEHLFRETVIQLWVNEASDKEPEWTTEKALGILNKVGSRKQYDIESEVYFEFGDSSIPTAKYSIEGIDVSPEEVTINLYVMPTVCKPSLEGNYSCC